MTDLAELERRLSALQKAVVVFTVEEESGVKLMLFGEVVANCGEHTRKATAILKLGALIRTLGAPHAEQ